MGGNVGTAARRTVVDAAEDAAMATGRAPGRPGAVAGARIARRRTAPVRRRRRASGPRPVRPGVAPMGGRPVQPARPAGPAGRGPARPGARVLVRRPVVLAPHIVRRRRVAAGLVVAVLALLAVFVLGLLADVAASGRTGSSPVHGPSLTVMVEGVSTPAG